MMSLLAGTNNQPLREALDEITKRYVNDNVAEQIPEIASLASTYPHTITLVCEAIPDKPETFQFNCYQYSFDLANVESVKRIMKNYSSVYPGREFVQFLIERRLEEISGDEANDQDHIIYSAGMQSEHAGKVFEGAIESKWGLMHLWRHDVFEVPWHYGNNVRFFRHLPQSESVQAFSTLPPHEDPTRKMKLYCIECRKGPKTHFRLRQVIEKAVTLLARSGLLTGGWEPTSNFLKR
jgi:hypothetical protein